MRNFMEWIIIQLKWDKMKEAFMTVPGFTLIIINAALVTIVSPELE